MSHALHRWRAEFPLLKTKTYLASHSLGAVPRGTSAALLQYYQEWSTLGTQAWDGPWWQAVLDFCSRIEGILGAPQGTVAPMTNATRGMAAVASALTYKGKRNRIVMTDLEFTTFYPVWQRQRALGARITLVRSPDGVTVPVQSLIDVIDERTVIVPTCHAYFRSGAVQDLRALVRAAHDAGAYVMGDGYQLVGSVPVDVQRLGVDFYVGGSHKWLCGGPGAGYLYVREELAKTLEPRLTGWFGLAKPFEYKQDTSGSALHEGVFRFLDGTPSVPGLYAAREGINIIRTIGVESIRKVSRELTDQILVEADRRKLKVRTPREFEQRNGMVCLDFRGAQEVTQELVKQGIVVDWRPDCGIRVSPHFYNEAADIERFFAALDGVRADRRTARAHLRAAA